MTANLEKATLIRPLLRKIITSKSWQVFFLKALNEFTQNYWQCHKKN